MRKSALLTLSLLLAACGADLAAVVNPLDEAGRYVDDQLGEAKDHLGKKANEARKHMSDRGFSSEKVGDKVSTAGDIVGEQANDARKYMSDRGFSGENMVDHGSMAQDHVGKKANETRKYLYERGIEEMRHGDKDLTNKVDSNTKRIENLEARVSTLEASLAVTDAKLSSEVLRLDMADAGNLATIRSELAGEVAQLMTIMTEVDSALASQLATLATRLTETQAELELAIKASDTKVRDDPLEELSDLKSELAGEVERLDYADESLKRRIKRVNRELWRLRGDFNDFKANQQVVNSIQDRKISRLKGQVRNLYSKYWYLKNHVNNLDISDIDGLSDTLSSVNSRLTTLFRRLQDLSKADSDLASDLAISLANGLAALKDEIGRLDVDSIAGLSGKLKDLWEAIDGIEPICFFSICNY